MSSFNNSLQSFTCTSNPEPHIIRRGKVPRPTAMPVRFAVLSQVKALTDTYNGTRSTAVKTGPVQHNKCTIPSPVTASNWNMKNSNAISGNRIWKMVERGIALENPEKHRAFERSKNGTVLPESSECGRARDLVAHKAGFKSFNSYYAAKNVYLNAHTAILELVEKGALKLTPASAIANLPYHKQHLIAQLIESLTRNSSFSSKMVSYLINNSTLDDETFLMRLRDQIHNTDICTLHDIKTLIASCASSPHIPPKNTPRPAPAPAAVSGGSIPSELEAVRTQLCAVPITESTIKSLSNTETHLTDKTLMHIERMACNFRAHMRIHSSFFPDTETALFKKYVLSMKESIHYFAHSLPRQKNPLEKSLRDELIRTINTAHSLLKKLFSTPISSPRD